jgi:hypothetical protein
VITCLKCNDPIIFDPSWVSERSGKKIPLDEYTHEPHKCPKSDFVSRVLECRHCEAEITFDDEHISKNGKKIPLDPGTMEAHHCEEGQKAWKEQQQIRKKKPLICKYCVETEIVFNEEHRTINGAYIPVDAATGEVHDCPKRKYNPNTRKTTTIF